MWRDSNDCSYLANDALWSVFLLAHIILTDGLSTYWNWHLQMIFSSVFSFLGLLYFSLYIVPRGPFDNKPNLLPIKDWRRTGDKLIFNQWLCILLTHICITRPWWIVSIWHLWYSTKLQNYSPNGDLHISKNLTSAVKLNGMLTHKPYV